MWWDQNSMFVFHRYIYVYVTNMLQAVGGYDLKWEEYVRVAM